MPQRIFLGVGEAEGHVVESEHFAVGERPTVRHVDGAAFGRVAHTRLRIEHFAHTAAAFECARQHGDHHLRGHEIEQCEDRVFDDRDDVTDLERPAVIRPPHSQ